MKLLCPRNLIVGLSVIGCAVGAVPSALAASSPGQRVYAIEMLADQRVLAVSASQTRATIAATQTRLAPCAEEILGGIPSQDAAAEAALERELGEQYVAESLAPIFKDLRQKAFALSALPSSTAFRTENRAFRQALTTLVSLDTCADYSTWEKAGFAPTNEPVGTQSAQRVLPSAPTPTVIATPAQLRVLNSEVHQASARYLQLDKQTQTSLMLWLESLPVQSTSPTPSSELSP